MTGDLRVVDDVAAAFRAVLEGARPATLALCGGRSAQQCYAALAGGSAVDWTGVEVLFSDERWVPVADDESNEGMARRLLLDHVPVRAVHSLRHAGTTVDEAARAYGRLVAGLDRIDLVHLGLGEDGHTASLFPGSPALEVRDRDVVAVAHSDFDRLTFTYRGISRARLVVVTVTGTAKRDAVARVRAGDPSAPASRIEAERVLWLADPAAAG